ncbi:hypothetical protein EV561_1053 [Rhizobium sp. BK376]|nr:hypothetical protein EV561_1053 [Rhizobium sp. BK376]
MLPLQHAFTEHKIACYDCHIDDVGARPITGFIRSCSCSATMMLSFRTQLPGRGGVPGGGNARQFLRTGTFLAVAHRGRYRHSDWIGGTARMLAHENLRLWTASRARKDSRTVPMVPPGAISNWGPINCSGYLPEATCVGAELEWLALSRASGLGPDLAAERRNNSFPDRLAWRPSNRERSRNRLGDSVRDDQT